MNKVRRLTEDTINKIAAGEVIERPASIVKELVENAIDSGASRIEVEIRNGGRQLIRVTDNGSGIDREDAVLAIERHTTSKIVESEDLWKLQTLGFRGEALPSIAAISRFELSTRTEGSSVGTTLEVKGGVLQKVKDSGVPVGTTVKVEDIFFNTPARLKYLKSIPTETGYITEIVSRLALGYPEIGFRLQHHEYEVLFTPGNGNLHDTVVAVFGKEVAKEMLAIDDEFNGIKIAGYIGKPSIARNNRNNEIFFINRRYFHSRVLSAAVEKAYHTLLPIARYPFVCLMIAIDPSLIDVNAHPSKMEVRFSNDSELFKGCYHGIRTVLKDGNLLSEWITPDEDFYTSQNINDFGAQTQPTTGSLNITFMDHPTVAQAALVKEDEENSYQPAPDASPIVIPIPASERSEFYVYPKAVQNTYIIIQDDKGLLFVDQHAAHERVLYERYLHRANDFLGTQALLLPETVNLNYSQYRIINERLSLFTGLGFELEPFGGKSIIIRGVPLSLMDFDYRQILLDLLEQFANFETFKNPAEIKESFIITMACRTAVKAGDKLNLLEMESLVKDLFRTENPYTCPHGRPTVFRMVVEELAKKFLRR